MGGPSSPQTPNPRPFLKSLAPASQRPGGGLGRPDGEGDPPSPPLRVPPSPAPGRRSNFPGPGPPPPLLRERESLQDPFLLFDFGPQSADITEAKTFLNKPLSYGRFTSATRKLLQCPPLEWSAEEASHISTYCFRKQLPTIGGLLHLEALERAALSNWSDPLGDKQAAKAIASSGARYDGSKLIQSLQVKFECISAARSAFAKLGTFQASFELLSTAIPSRESLAES